MKRDSSLDAMKGLAIAMVVSGHAMLYSSWVFHGGPGLVPSTAIAWVPMSTAVNPWFNFIQFAQMPLFALVSGIVMWPPRDRTLGSQVGKRAMSLLVPYAAWFALYIFVAYEALDQPREGLSALAIGALLGRSGALWYLYTLFICAVAVLAIQKLPRANWILAGTALIAALAFTGLTAELSNLFALGHVLWIYPFVVAGYLLAPLRERVLAHRVWIGTVSAALFALLFWAQTPVLIASDQPIAGFSGMLQYVARRLASHGMRGGFLLSRIPMLLLYVSSLAIVLAVWSAMGGRDGRAVRALAWLGRKSLGIYVMHFPLVLGMIALGLKNPIALWALALAGASSLTPAVERVPGLSNVLLGQRALPWRELPTLVEPAEKDSL